VEIDKESPVKIAFAGFALALVASSAVALPINDYDFTGSGGNLGKREQFVGSAGWSIQVTAINTEQPPGARLFQSPFGLGVRADSTDACGGLFEDDCDELDNVGDDEAIVFDFGRMASLTSASLTLAFLDDEYEFYGSNNDAVENVTSGGRAALTSISTLLTSGFGEFDTTRTVSFASITEKYRYLIAMTPGTGGIAGDGYKIAGLTGVAPVPVPAGVALALTALGVFAGLRRRTAATA
jgi:hypothetical protein